MKVKLNNTLTGRIDEFIQITPDQVKIYQCGPTVYSRQHIGNLRAAVVGDLIRRTFAYLGQDVIFTRNITDVGHLTGDNEGDADAGEDRMVKGAKKERLTPEQIADKYTKLYHTDINLLNTVPPTYETVASEYVDQMAEHVQELINLGFAYATKKAIYFEVDKFPKYNKLNKQKLDKNLSGAGHGNESDPDKKQSYDFAIWFFKVGNHKNALQVWEKRFLGITQKEFFGFPGWHIECSAMSRATLGDTFDIHLGGVEHISTHHTNEIAQSESVTGKTMANYWLHHEHLLVNSGKMSKSEGNVVDMDQIIEKGFNPLAVRYLFLQAGYRSKQNFTWEALESAQTSLDKLYRYLSANIDNSQGNINQKAKEKFIAAISNDFNFPIALSVVWNLVKSGLRSEDIIATLLDFDQVLGLKLESSISNPESIELSPVLEKLLEERKSARDSKDWELSDKIRKRVEGEFRFTIKDTKEGQQLEPLE